VIQSPSQRVRQFGTPVSPFPPSHHHVCKGAEVEGMDGKDTVAPGGESSSSRDAFLTSGMPCGWLRLGMTEV